MNRSARLFVVLLVALAAAAAASYSIYRVVRQIPVREVEVSSVKAVVAARRVEVGTLLGKGDVKLVDWPASSPVPGSFTDIALVEGRGTISALAENEIITDSKLAAAGTGAGLPPQIPVGMRAISVKVNEVIGVAGFVVPGTRVDVLVTVTASGQRDSMSRLVVSNVQVLTAGTRYDQEKSREDGKAIQSTVVTLLATPEDSERIALAQNEGRINLVLRNPLDTDPVTTQGAKLASLVGPPAPPPVEKQVKGRRVMVATTPPPPPPPPKPYTVEAIRGAKRTEEPIK